MSDSIFTDDQWEDNYQPVFVDKHRLDEEYFGLLETDLNSAFNDSPEELEYIKMSADQNKKAYILKMARIYMYGLRGQERDYTKSFSYLLKASKLGEITSKTSMGEMYIRGLGVPKNYKKAFSLLNEAALQNDPQASNALGILALTYRK